MIQSSESNTPDPNKSPLRQLREKAGLTRFQVRQHIGVSEQGQADWELNNVVPSAENIAALARLYKVSLKTVYESVGIDLAGIPDSDNKQELNTNLEQNHITHHEISKQNDMLDESERQGEPQGFLRNLRNRLDISQERLAGLIGVTGQTISRCERGQTEITLTVLEFKRLCRLAKKTSIEELPDYLGKTPEKDPEKNQQE